MRLTAFSTLMRYNFSVPIENQQWPCWAAASPGASPSTVPTAICMPSPPPAPRGRGDQITPATGSVTVLGTLAPSGQPAAAQLHGSVVLFRRQCLRSRKRLGWELDAVSADDRCCGDDHFRSANWATTSRAPPSTQEGFTGGLAAVPVGGARARFTPERQPRGDLRRRQRHDVPQHDRRGWHGQSPHSRFMCPAPAGQTKPPRLGLFLRRL